MAFVAQLAVLLASIVVGARLGGISLGPMGGLGLLTFVFLFRLPPGSPPGTVLGMILAVITALSLMQAAGGLDYVIQLAEKVLRRSPRRVTILAPIVTYVLDYGLRNAARDLCRAPGDCRGGAQGRDSA
jgi:anaerobic C4-dicarboxylate transporter